MQTHQSRTPFAHLPKMSGILGIVLFLLLLMVPGRCLAQFNGPSLSANYGVNHLLVPTTDPALLYPTDREIRLGPGDAIAVHIYGSNDYDQQDKVTVDGSILLPLIGVVHVGGLGLHETERTIADRLIEAGMYRNPQVTVLLTDSPNQVATVVGEMHGVIPVIGRRRLFDVLSAAGGFTATSSHVITIQRVGVAEPIIVDLGNDPSKSQMSNVPVFPQDTIIVARVGLIYVMGSVRSQGAVPLNSTTPLTMMQVLALSGGSFFESRLNQARIVRTNGTARTVIQVDLQAVIKGKKPDPILQADDVVIIPTNQIRAALKAGVIGTVIGVATSFIYFTQVR